MVIEHQEDLIYACNEMRRKSFVTVDTEFLREKTYYPQLCLVQLAATDMEPVAIDPIKGDLNLTPLFDLMADTNIVKVFHAARQDLEIFYNLSGSIPAPFFDTQIAAMVCGFGDSAGYETLVRRIKGVRLDKAQQYTNWAQRPLTDAQVDYALADVTHLIDVYLHLRDKLEKAGRTQWVNDEIAVLEDPATYINRPEDAWQRIKFKAHKPVSLAVLRDLAAWREEQASIQDLPRNWVMKDQTLTDLAIKMPKDEGGLSKIRELEGSFKTGEQAKMLLKIIHKAEKSDRRKWPRVERREIVDDSTQRVIDLLKLLLRIKAEQHSVSAKIIASSSDLQKLAVENDPDMPFMRGWRYDIFGKYVEDVKRGQLAIGLRDGEADSFKLCQNQ